MGDKDRRIMIKIMREERKKVKDKDYAIATLKEIGVLTNLGKVAAQYIHLLE